ncbi:hypothetical protein CH365_04740 [Leptospira neocaledonica]|uniref:Uncharacterized protein n=1 Tax=Leptospira neocaledonica TaxID=2023192 RepID=A0A2N0A2P9_9LEPT|nr:hypothetical protein CH365_04740 [Leptospira neocaledonica]
MDWNNLIVSVQEMVCLMKRYRVESITFRFLLAGNPFHPATKTTGIGVKIAKPFGSIIPDQQMFVQTEEHIMLQEAVPML